MARTALTPLTWRVGVDNEFGMLVADDGPRRLCEVRRIVKDREAVLICLQDGETVIAPADGTVTWQPIDADRACAAAGIPAPEWDGEAELKRRTDPLHVERHTSPRWRTIVKLDYDRGLPCGYALNDWLRGDFDGAFRGMSFEAPEKFASHVAERLARDDTLRQAITGALARQGDLPDEEMPDLLEITGWAQAIEHLETQQAAGWPDAPAPHQTLPAIDFDDHLILEDPDGEQLSLI